MFKLMRFNTVSAQFKEVFSDKNIESVLDYSDGEEGNLHIRVGDSMKQNFRGPSIVEARIGYKTLKEIHPDIDDETAMKILNNAIDLNDDDNWWMDIEDKVKLVVCEI